MTVVDGSLLLGAKQQRKTTTFRAFTPLTGETLDPPFSVAGKSDVSEACALAEEAFDAYRRATAEQRAVFLETVADHVAALGDDLIQRAGQESGLPKARLTGELARTVGQLRLFAGVVRGGEWLGLRVDEALPDRTPPRPDLRLRHIPLGPVAVFGASNFPLAFSVAGGDTAAALAAGCPVIAKAHPAHPGTSEMVGRAIQKAITLCSMPEGTFSLLGGPGYELGTALVQDHRIKAVAFTGSRAGGLALMSVAAARKEPIPVFAEMSSVNPVILGPAALATETEALARGFVASLTLGAGQFCTNPGLVFGIASDSLDRFAQEAAKALEQVSSATMLTRDIHARYEESVKALSEHPNTVLLARGCASEGGTQGRGALFETTAKALLEQEALASEVFGASSLIVRCETLEEMETALLSLEGQLTATLQIATADFAMAERLIPLLEKKAGRILVNGWPTGVEVTHAMVHGGPFPATSDGRSTSVGSLAIRRFLRPVCYQNMPEALLPAELLDPAEQKFPVMLNGQLHL